MDSTFLQSAVNPGSVMTLQGALVEISECTIHGLGGAAAIRQVGHLSQSHFDRVRVINYDSTQSLYDNAGFDYIDVRWTRFILDHYQTATVPAIKLVAQGGSINANSFEKFRANYSGNYVFWIESTTANAQYDNSIRDGTFEICTGGLIRLISVSDYEVENCANYDMQGGTPNTLQRHGVYATANAFNIPCYGTIRRMTRLAGSLGTGIVDVALPNGGAGTGTVIGQCSAPAGPYTVDLGYNACVVEMQQGGRTTLLNKEGATIIGLDTPDWLAYTPVLGGTGWAVGNGTLTGRSIKIGHTVHFQVSFILGATSTAGSVSPTFTLPYPQIVLQPYALAKCDLLDAGFTTYSGAVGWTTTTIIAYSIGVGGVVTAVTTTAPFTWGTGDRISVSGTYETS